MANGVQYQGGRAAYVRPHGSGVDDVVRVIAIEFILQFKGTATQMAR